MMAKDFKVGERVMVYEYGRTVEYPVIGTVTGPGPLPGTTYVKVGPHAAKYTPNQFITRLPEEETVYL